jgi:hypothetical protein
MREAMPLTVTSTWTDLMMAISSFEPMIIGGCLLAYVKSSDVTFESE